MRRRDKQRGATTAEFVTVLPLLLVVMFGAIDGAFMLLSRYMVTHAAVVGARTASVRSVTTVAAVKAAAVNAVQFLSLPTSAVTVRVNGGSPATDPTFAAAKSTGSSVSVTVTYAYSSFTGVFSKIGNTTMNATSTTRVE
jgi:Flp pilus assembly protein TadG